MAFGSINIPQSVINTIAESEKKYGIIPAILGFAQDAWKRTTYSPKWWFDGDLPWYRVKNHLKQIQDYLDVPGI